MKKVMISEKQLESLVSSLRNESDEHESGSYMAKQQLYIIATLAMAMWEKMEDGEQLEDWMETKIAQSEQSVLAVVKSFMYGEVEDDIRNGGLNLDNLIIGK